ncbi:MAG: ATPase domain-containing protein [Candidatus Bathyarchaeota archaeon]
MQDDILNSFLIKAKEEEKKYKWIQAAKNYKKASELVLAKNISSEYLDIIDQIGFCYHRAAFQSKTNTEFRERFNLAIQAYEKEIQIITERKDKNQVRIKHAEALINYSKSWLENNVQKKKILLCKWWALEKQVLEEYERIGNIHSVGIVCTDLIEFSQYTLIWLTDYLEWVEIEQEALNLAERAIQSLSKTGNNFELARAYCFASLWLSRLHISPEFRAERVRLIQRCRDYSNKALELSMKIDDAWLIGNSYISLKNIANNYNIDFKLALEFREKILHYGRIAKDNRVLSSQANAGPIAIVETIEFLEDPDRRRAFLEKEIILAQESIRISQIIDHMVGVLAGYSNEIMAHAMLALIETDPRVREAMLVTVVEMNRMVLKFFDEWKRFRGGFYSLLGVGLFLLGLQKREVKEKKVLLVEAKLYHEKFLAHTEEFFPYNDGIKSLGYYILTIRISGLADIESNKTEKVKLLEQALDSLQKSDELLILAGMPENIFSIQIRGKHSDRLGKILQQIYSLTKERRRLSEAIKAYNNAALDYTKAELPAHAAESYWHVAQIQSHQGKYQEASQNYKSASKSYDLACKKIPQFNNFYKDYSFYMQAWSQFEQARYFHSIDDYEDAQYHYEKAAKLHESTRRRYCQARILMEEARLLDRKGRYLESSRNYGEAAHKISMIIDAVNIEAESKELEYVAILCRAWEKMAEAEETTSAESYLEAAELFEQAKDHCYTKKASLWALGNSNFCRGLAAGAEYQTRLDVEKHNEAKVYIKNAAINYLKAGYRNASEYAKATQRLFDAYVFMNQAENELDQDERAKLYQMIENLLQIAAGSFMKAKQPEKTAQVQKILDNVREEKALAISLSQIMQAPSIVSTTRSFTAPSPTGEVSVGLEQFEHANVQANVIADMTEVRLCESFCLSIEFVNAGREPALLTKVENFISSDFVVVKKPKIYRIENTTLNMKGKQLAPLKLVEVKLTLQPSKKGKYQFNPMVHYLDELGLNKTLRLKSVEIKVEEVHLEDRISTGTQELDSLLLGGVPNEFTIVLTGSPSDERDHVIKNFLIEGIKKDEVVFFVATEPDKLDLLENSNFVLFLCNPKPKSEIPDFPNVYKLRSKTDLTNLSISLTKAYRNLDSSKKKRICIEIISDVLVDYGAKATRKWISELITELGTKGFTILAVMDPEMHPSDQSKAVINLFDGEISIIQSEDPLDCKKSILVKKLRNQDFIKNPICLIDFR